MTYQTEMTEDATSERVSFTCPGCGRDTTIHVGRDSRLTEKRCFKCVGTLRSGRGGAGPQKGRRIGTHEGRRTGDKADAQRATARAASARNLIRRGDPTRKPCRSYDECSHKKHSVASGNGRR